jgi:hypothetical protein
MPIQQITHNVFTVQLVIAYMPEEFEVQALNIINICLLLFFSHL